MNMPAAWCSAAPCSKSSAFTMSARSTATTSNLWCRCCRMCAMPKRGPILVHVVTEKGKGNPFAGAQGKVPRGRQVRSRDRRAVQRQVERAELYQGVCRSLIKEAEKDDSIVAITAAMPSGTGLDTFRSISRPVLRCRHRRTACGDLRGRLATEGCKPFARSIRPSCSAPTTRSCTMWRCRTCPSALPSTGPDWSARTGRPMPAVSTSPISAACPNFVVMAAADEAELVHMVATRPRSTTAPARSATRAAKASASSCRRRRAAGNRQGPDRQGRHQGRPAVVRRAAAACLPRRENCAPGPVDHGRRCPLRQTARRRSDPRLRASMKC